MSNIFREHSQWEKEKGFLISNTKVLNEKQLDLEKEREEKEKDKHRETGQPRKKSIIEAIVQAMSQVSLRDEEIKRLKIETQNMAEIVRKNEEEIHFFENKKKELMDTNEKLAERISR